MDNDFQWVTVSGKEYRVATRDGVPYEITITWETPHPSDRWSLHPRMIHRYASVSLSGVTGRKVLAEFAKKAQQ